jgi:ketopantoate reductase
VQAGRGEAALRFHPRRAEVAPDRGRREAHGGPARQGRDDTARPERAAVLVFRKARFAAARLAPEISRSGRRARPIDPADLVEPGRIRLADQPTDRLVIGELDNRVTPRLQAIKALFDPAGWPVFITDNIRAAKWRKLLSNAVFNPLGALTQSSALQIAQFPPTQAIAKRLMDEVMAVAASVGVSPEMTPAQMMDDVLKRVGILSSTLQDVRFGRELELDAIVNAVIDVGRLTGTPAPFLEMSAACAGLLNQRIVRDGVAFAPAPVGRG